MTSIESAALKNKLLNSLFDRAVEGKSNRYASPTTLKRALKATESSQLLGVMLDALVDTGYVRKGDHEKFAITDAGIEFMDSGWQYAPAPLGESWASERIGISLSAANAETVRLHLGQCIVLISTSKFTQAEKAQIIGLLRICEQIVDLPAPKLSLLRRILAWLKEIKELVPLVEAILRLVGKP